VIFKTKKEARETKVLVLVGPRFKFKSPCNSMNYGDFFVLVDTVVDTSEKEKGL